MSKTITVRFDEELLGRLTSTLAGGNRNAWITDLVRRELEHLDQVGGSVRRPEPKPKREMSARELSDPGFPKSKPAKASLSAALKPDAPKNPPLPKLRPDDEALLDLLGGVSSTDAKRACEALGWLPGRYAKAERALLSSGRATSRMGLLIKV